MKRKTTPRRLKGIPIKGYCGADGRPVARTKRRAFLDALMPIATATGTGSWYVVWNNGKRKKTGDMPVVVFGDAGAVTTSSPRTWPSSPRSWARMSSR